MSAPALMEVACSMVIASASASARDSVSDIDQRHKQLRESIDEARPRCSRCGADEDRLIRRPELSQTLICGVCGTDTLIGMDFDVGRTFAYEDEDADSAPTAQALVSAFGDLRTNPSRKWASAGGARIRGGFGTNFDAAAVDRVELRRCDRSDMVAALSEVIKAHAREAIGASDDAPIVELPFEPNARRRTQHCILARRRIANGANLLRMLANSDGETKAVAGSVVVPRYRAVYDSGVEYLNNVGDWIGSREACLLQWRAVICDWYRGSGVQQRNYHIFMLIAIVRAGMVTGCLIPPERAVFEMSQTLRLLRSIGLSSVHSIDLASTVLRFYNRWDLICNSAVFTTAVSANSASATHVLRQRCQFLMEQPATEDMFLAVNRKNDASARHDDDDDRRTYSWLHLVMGHIRWFAQNVFAAPHTRFGADLICAAERLTLIVWERRHELNETKRRAMAAYDRGPVACHSYWRYLRESERLLHLSSLYMHAYNSPWFTDVPVFVDTGAWACAFINTLMTDGQSVQWRPEGLDVCDYMGHRVRDIMPFVAAIQAVRLLV